MPREVGKSPRHRFCVRRPPLPLPPYQQAQEEGRLLQELWQEQQQREQWEGWLLPGRSLTGFPTQMPAAAARTATTRQHNPGGTTARSQP